MYDMQGALRTYTSTWNPKRKIIFNLVNHKKDPNEEEWSEQ